MLGRDVTSSASSPSASSSPASAACRSRRRSAAIAGREMADQPLESQAIAVGAEPGHDPDGEVRQQGVPPLRLPREDVREVHLDEGYAHGEQGVAYREAG